MSIGGLHRPPMLFENNVNIKWIIGLCVSRCWCLLKRHVCHDTTGQEFDGHYIEEVTLSLVDNLNGDANHDGKVEVGDLGILAAHYGMEIGATWEQGDFNHDGKVDVGDLGILAASYGTGMDTAADLNADDTKVFGFAVDDVDSDEESNGTLCSSLGLPLIAGLVLMGLMLVKLEVTA